MEGHRHRSTRRRRARRLRMVLGPSTSFCSQLLYNVSCFTTSIALQNCLCSPDYRPLLYGVETHTKRPDPQRSKLISQKLLTRSFCKSQLPHTSVNLFFTLVILKDKLTTLCGNQPLQKSFISTFCETKIASPSSQNSVPPEPTAVKIAFP